MECRACNLLKEGKGGIDQDEHYGGCIPEWVETEDVWAILSKPLSIEEIAEDLSIEEIVEDVESIDIETFDNESDMSE